MADHERIQLDLVTKFHGGELSGAIRGYEKLINLHDALSARLATPMRFGVTGLAETARRIDAMTARVKTSADAFKDALIKMGDPGSAAKVEAGARSPTQVLAERQRMVDRLRKQAESMATAARQQESVHAKTDFFALPVNADKASALQRASRIKLEKLNAEASRAQESYQKAQQEQRALTRAASYAGPASAPKQTAAAEKMAAAETGMATKKAATEAKAKLDELRKQLTAEESRLAAVPSGRGTPIAHQQRRMRREQIQEKISGLKGEIGAAEASVSSMAVAEDKLAVSSKKTTEQLGRNTKAAKVKGESLVQAAVGASQFSEGEEEISHVSGESTGKLGLLRRQTDETGKKLNELASTGLGTTAFTKFTDEGEKVIHTEDMLAASTARAAASENAYRTKIKQSGSDLTARLGVTNDSIASLRAEAQALADSAHGHTAQAARIERLIAARTGEKAVIQGKIDALEGERQKAQDSLQTQVTGEERLARVRAVRSRFDRLTAGAEQPSQRADLLERRAAALRKEADTMRSLGVNEREERRVRAEANGAANEALRIRTAIAQQSDAAQGRLQKEIYLEGNLAEARRVSATAARALSDKSLDPSARAAILQRQATDLERVAAAMHAQGDDEKAILRVRQEATRAANQARSISTADAVDRQRQARRSREAAMVTSGFNPAGFERGDVKTVTKGGGPAGVIKETTSEYSKLVGKMQENVTVWQRTDAAGKVLETRFQSVNTELKDLGRTGDFAARSFLHNTFVVASWATSVAAFQGVVGALQFGAKGAAELERSTAILLNVFRYGSEEAYKLRDSVLELGAANGRSAHESLDAAIRFSRMGLTRAQVIEAVTVSLKAANVAEISSAEAAEYLSAIMAGFKLQVRDLGIVLNELNTISNTYNVTNKDMLEGIARVGSLANQARLPLEELMGIIATGVGRTGRAGSEFGNAIKAMIVSISTPAIQEKLKLRFDFDVKDSAGEIKDMSTLLGELYVKYEQLGLAERQELLQRVGQKQQASRLAAVIDGYVQTQVLAIRAQRDLNSAERENQAIRATMLSQLQSLGTEFQRAFLNMTASGQSSVVTNTIQNSIKVMTNAIRLFSEFPGVGSLVIAMLGVMAYRVASLAVAMDAASGKGNFFTNTIKQVGAAVTTVSATMSAANKQLAMTGGWLGGIAKGGRSASAGLLLMTRGIPVISGIGRALTGVIKVATFALGALRSLIGGLVGFFIIQGVFAGINYAVDKFTGGLTNAEKAQAALNRRIDEMGHRAGAFEQSARLFDTISKAAASPLFSQEQGRLAARGVAEVVFPDDEEHRRSLQQELALLFQQKDVEAIQARLAKLKVQAIESGRREREGELRATQVALANDERALRNVRKIIAEKNRRRQPAQKELEQEKELSEAVERHKTKQESGYKIMDEEAGENRFEKIAASYAAGREKGLDRFAQKLPAAFTETGELQDQLKLLRAKLSLEEKITGNVEGELVGARRVAEEKLRALNAMRESLMAGKRLDTEPVQETVDPRNTQETAEASARNAARRRTPFARSIEVIDRELEANDKATEAASKNVNALHEQIDLHQHLTAEKEKAIAMSIREVEAQLRLAQATDAVALAGRKAHSEEARLMIGRNETEKMVNQSWELLGVRPYGKPVAKGPEELNLDNVNDELRGEADALTIIGRQAQIREHLLRLQQNEAALTERKGQLEAEITNEKLKQTMEASKALLLASREDQLQAALAARFANDRGSGFSINDFQFLSQGARQNIERFTPNLAPPELNLPLQELQRESDVLAKNFDALSLAIGQAVQKFSAINPQQAAADFAGVPPPPVQPAAINLQIAAVNVSLAEQGAGLVAEFQSAVRVYVDPQIAELRQLISTLTVPRPVVITNAGAR